MAATRPVHGAEQVTGYRGLERAGQGQFSIVYRAVQEQPRRTVALKVILLDGLDHVELRRFRRECQLTSRLSSHPHVVTPLDVGTTCSGRPYVAMNYFERGSLGDRLAREGPLPVQDVVRAGLEIAGALGAAHAVGILHRDVRPPNILVYPGGEHAVADFGIAELTADRSQWLSPHHTAPEVLQGGPPSIAADVYSLGATLYELLMGRPPHEGAAIDGTEALLRRVPSGPPEIPRQDVPQALVALIGQAMAGRPDQRILDAFTFADRLRQLQGHLGVVRTAPPPARQQHRSPATTEPATGGRPVASNVPNGPEKARRWTQRVPIGPLVPAAERDRARNGRIPVPEAPPASEVPTKGKGLAGRIILFILLILFILVGWTVEVAVNSAMDTLLRTLARSGQHATVAPPPPGASAAPTPAIPAT